MTMEEIKKVYPDTNSLLGSSVYVKASVLTSSGEEINFGICLASLFRGLFFLKTLMTFFSGSDLVEAEKSGIKIAISPYVLSIRDTMKYFKPGLPLAVTVIQFLLLHFLVQGIVPLSYHFHT